MLLSQVFLFYLMHSVGVLFKQLLSNRDFCLRDPSDLVPFPLNSEEIDQTMRALLSFPPDDSVILWKKLQGMARLLGRPFTCKKSG